MISINDLCIFFQNLDGSQDFANFKAAVKKTPSWLRRLHRRSLMLSLKDLQSLYENVNITTSMLDGPQDIDIVNMPSPSKFEVKNYEMKDYVRTFTKAAST